MNPLAKQLLDGIECIEQGQVLDQLAALELDEVGDAIVHDTSVYCAARRLAVQHGNVVAVDDDGFRLEPEGAKDGRDAMLKKVYDRGLTAMRSAKAQIFYRPADRPFDIVVQIGRNLHDVARGISLPKIFDEFVRQA